MGMMDWLILADDMTGALDTGVQFVGRAITYVVTETVQNVPSDARALVVNTNSRHDEPTRAADTVRRMILRHPARSIYKKTDSVLRGNVAAELAALGHETGETVCFVPFYPAQGRATRQGIQYVQGVRVDCSAFAHDPANPVTQADIARLLAQVGLSACVVAPPYVLPDALPDVLIFDGATEEDLCAVARVIDSHCLWRAVAGCAGFAAHLPAGECTPPASIPEISHPFLIVSGSAAAATRRQIAFAQAQGVPVFFPTREHIMRDASASPLLEQCEAALRTYGVAVLASATEDTALFHDLPEGRLQGQFAAWTAVLMEQSHTETLMAIGGDLLAEILRVRGVEVIRPMCEVLPGIPLCEIGGHQLLTKSGGFGGDTTLLDIAKGGIR